MLGTNSLNLLRTSTALLTLACVSCDTSGEEGESGANAASSAAIGPNSGFIFRLLGADEEGVGTAEIKLHDDKGDLEVWINQGTLAESMQSPTPWDLPLDTQLKIEFPELEKEVVLRPRDTKTNADEAGTSMIREGKTNYFIFPGDSGADAAWLQGHHFEESVVLSFNADGAEVTTGVVRLVPHGHSDKDHAHDHPHPH